ncbi:Protein FAR1-RELATED SEQUENCE 5 [Linum grandiflorum]
MNYCYIDDVEKIVEGDAATALAYLKGKTNHEDNFFMEFTTDDKNMLEKVFWADSMSIADFACFRDVLAFDAAYKKIEYNLPLVIFSGVNHHFKTCIFGCAFMQHEKEENYVWALQTLKKAMGGRSEYLTLTDRDKAMYNAIKLEFPEAAHRLCAWHLNSNISDHVKNSKFRNEWSKFVREDCESEEVWTEKWNEFLTTCGVQDNNWIGPNLFDKRHEWADTCLRGKFMAGIRTTSRCEGLNSQISKHVKHSSKLLQFFLGFDQLISEMREVELNLDFKCIQRAPEIRYLPLRSLERSAAALFSTKAFKKFRAQLDLCSGCIKEGVKIDGNSHIYTVSMYEPDTPPRTVRVTYDTSTDSAGCNCGRFDGMGISCTHMIFVLKEEGKSVIPQSYVMHRWSKNPDVDICVVTILPS